MTCLACHLQRMDHSTQFCRCLDESDWRVTRYKICPLLVVEDPTCMVGTIRYLPVRDTLPTTTRLFCHQESENIVEFECTLAAQMLRLRKTSEIITEADTPGMSIENAGSEARDEVLQHVFASAS